MIEARAHFDGRERKVHIRVGGLDGKIYLDLCNAAWQAIEIDATGWRVIDNPPVRFRRTSGMLPLPVPMAGGKIGDLRPFLNVKSDDDFVLAVAWVLAALRDCGPYPAIDLAGEQGTAKSTLARILRTLVDPSTSPLRALPREDRDLFIAANNAHVLSFDNVSNLSEWTSDTLCRLSTGGGFTTRALYSDTDEVLFDGARPAILNGIEGAAIRPDLADRTLFLTLDPIPRNKRRTEKDLWAAFKAVQPQILGTLLEAVVEGLARLPETRLEELPRMADFALWATACEMAMWEAGTFWRAYSSNLDEATESVLEADTVATTLRSFMAERKEAWTGTAGELLVDLNEAAGERANQAKEWPKNPRALSGRLRRAAPGLRKVGIGIKFDREGKARARKIEITTTSASPGPEREGKFASFASAASASRNFDGLGRTQMRTQTGDTDANARGDTPTVRNRGKRPGVQASARRMRSGRRGTSGAPGTPRRAPR